MAHAKHELGQFQDFIRRRGLRMTEERRISTVLTLDRGFRRYRRLGRQVIPLISPK